MCVIQNKKICTIYLQYTYVNLYTTLPGHFLEQVNKNVYAL